MQGLGRPEWPAFYCGQARAVELRGDGGPNKQINGIGTTIIALPFTVGNSHTQPRVCQLRTMMLTAKPLLWLTPGWA